MKSFFSFAIAALALLWAVSPASGDMPPKGPAYISDTIRVTLRSGPSIENKIVALLGAGQKIEVVEPGDEWSFIRTDNGKEGWVLSTFITTGPPNIVLLEYAKKKVDELSAKCSALEEANRKLVEENRALKDSMEKQARETKEKLEALSRENTILRDSIANRFIKWFLAGAGVLLAGFFIGYQAKRDRSRLF